MENFHGCIFFQIIPSWSIGANITIFPGDLGKLDISPNIATILAADPPLVVSSRFTHVCACVRPQLTKLFNIFGSG